MFIAEIRASLAGEGAMVGGGDPDGVGQGAPDLPPIRVTEGTCIEPISPGRVTPPRWDCRPARFARRLWKRATSPRRAVSSASASMPNALPARRFGQAE
jgi:hypothetical protein